MNQKPAIEGGTPVRATALPFHRPLIGPEEEALVLEVLRSGWLTRGPQVDRLEKRLQERTGAARVLALNSCTAALELALEVAGVGDGDEVITSAHTFAATANVAFHRRARPVLVDVEPDTLNLSPEAVAAAITPRSRAIVAVDFAGHPAEYDALRPLADAHGLTLIADAAHAMEALYRQRPVPTWADYTCFSFYANKNMTTGEGGALLARNPGTEMDRAAILSLHGMSRHAWNRFGAAGFHHYDVTAAGHKWNMFDLQAALGLAQLDRVDTSLEQRESLCRHYDEGLSGLDALEVPAVRPHVRSARHLYIIRLRPQRLRVDRDHVLAALKAEGINVAVHYRALPQLTLYQQELGCRPEEFPVACDAGDRCISLPLFPGMTPQEADDVITAVRRIVDYYAG